MVLKLNIIIPPVCKLNRDIYIALELQLQMYTPLPPLHSNEGMIYMLKEMLF